MAPKGTESGAWSVNKDMIVGRQTELVLCGISGNEAHIGTHAQLRREMLRLLQLRTNDVDTCHIRSLGCKRGRFDASSRAKVKNRLPFHISQRLHNRQTRRVLGNETTLLKALAAEWIAGTGDDDFVDILEHRPGEDNLRGPFGRDGQVAGNEVGMSVEDGRDEFVTADRYHYNVDLDVATAQFLVDV